MSVADKLLQVNQVKQDIKSAIETKGVPMTNVAFTEYANKIADISGGGGEVDEYFYYSKAYYTITNNSTLFSNAWQKQIDSKNVIYDIDVTLVAPNQEMGGMYLDLYIGDSDLTQLYNDCVNEVIPLPPSGNIGDIYLINNIVVKYYGDISGDVGFPIPLFEFGSMDDVNGFIIGDLTPLSMGLGLVLAKIVNVSIPNNNIVIQQGFDFEEPSGIILPDSITSIDKAAFSSWTANNQPLIIPNSVTSIGEGAFYNWTSNNQPLVIPNSVTSIGELAFWNWIANNQPLVIPDSVTSIGESAFTDWWVNRHPLVIPNSVTSIGEGAFRNWSNVLYVEMKSETPPTLTNANAFVGQNNAPIYVPDSAVDTYQNTTNWSALASRIFPISEK